MCEGLSRAQDRTLRDNSFYYYQYWPSGSNLFGGVFLERRVHTTVNRGCLETLNSWPSVALRAVNTAHKHQANGSTGWLKALEWGRGAGGAGGRSRTQVMSPLQSIPEVSGVQASLLIHRGFSQHVPCATHRAGCWDPVVSKTICDSCPQGTYSL